MSADLLCYCSCTDSHRPGDPRDTERSREEALTQVGWECGEECNLTLLELEIWPVEADGGQEMIEEDSAQCRYQSLADVCQSQVCEGVEHCLENCGVAAETV